MTLTAINAMDRIEFVDTLGWIFEHSPWVAERAFDAKPFATLQSLHLAMVKAVDASSGSEQLELIRAHPDLGARARMSDASVGEQAGAGLDQMTASEYETLRDLNRRYQQKFGFPFIYAVKGSTRHDILVALGVRLDSDPPTEQQAALTEIARIAWFRLAGAIQIEETN